MKQNKKGNILLPLISGIAILAVLAGGFLWLNLSKMQKSENPILLNPPDIPGNNQAVEQIMISDLDDSWQLAVNEKYHYQIQVPKTTEGSHHPDDLRFYYQSTNHQRAFLGSISIGLVGMINESPEKFLGKMYPSPPSITTESLNGLTFYKTEARKDGSGTYYYTYFVLGPDNLFFTIHFVTSDLNLSADEYHKALRSFKFTKTPAKLPRSLVLSGVVKETSGNCMPGTTISRTCRSVPRSTKVYIYPLSKLTDGAGHMAEPDKMITQTMSGPDGQYLVNLSAGSYSVFIDDNGRKYCSTMDGHGFACKVTLYETPEEMHLKIDHASY